jgi:hypothetical protein
MWMTRISRRTLIFGSEHEFGDDEDGHCPPTPGMFGNSAEVTAPPGTFEGIPWALSVCQPRRHNLRRTVSITTSEI